MYLPGSFEDRYLTKLLNWKWKARRAKNNRR
jgi:hypothetical protein